MIYVVIVVSVIVGIVSCIVEDGSIFSKLALAAFVVAIACLLLRWITGFEIFIALAKVCGASIVILTLINLLGKIF